MGHDQTWPRFEFSLPAIPFYHSWQTEDWGIWTLFMGLFFFQLLLPQVFYFFFSPPDFLYNYYYQRVLIQWL